MPTTAAPLRAIPDDDLVFVDGGDLPNWLEPSVLDHPVARRGHYYVVTAQQVKRAVIPMRDRSPRRTDDPSDWPSTGPPARCERVATAMSIVATVVLPCYNEEGHVLEEIARISRAMDASGLSYELLVIDDASTDHTLQVVQSAAATYPDMRVLPFHRNGGSGTARRIGTREARGEIVVWTDADMTYPNERIPELVRMLLDDPTIDQVVGARTAEEGTYKVLRVPAKWLIRKIAEWLSGTKIPDLNSGPAGVPPRGLAAVPAAAAARLLLRHDDDAGVPVQPARHPLRADRVRHAGRHLEVPLRQRRVPLHPAGPADGHVLQPAQGPDAAGPLAAAARGRSRSSTTWSRTRSGSPPTPSSCSSPG